MFGIITKSLMGRLVVLFVLGALVSVAVVASLSFYYSTRSLEDAAFNQLSAVNEIKKHQVLADFKERISDLSILSQSENVHTAFDLLKRYHDAGGGDPNGSYDTESKEYKEIYQQIAPFFRKYLDAYGYRDIFLICRDHGHVMYTAARENDLGANLKVGPYRSSGLAKLWMKVVKDKKAVMVDFAPYAPSNSVASFIGVPQFSGTDEVESVLALQIGAEDLDSIMQEKTGMGETGESYLVGGDFLMRSDSRFAKESTILKTKVDTVAVRNALANKPGMGTITDYRGVKVLSSYTHLDLDKILGTSFDWVIISEIDEAEAMAPVWALGEKILLAAVILLVLLSLVGYFSSRSIVRPLKELVGHVVRMADGDLTVNMTPSKRKDEVGVLMNAFHVTLGTLRDQTRQMIEGISDIASSISQISATASQLAASASETSSSVSEITATVEEVKQTAHLSSEKSRQMADEAEQATEVSHRGKTATDEAEKGMRVIKEQMADVAESIVRLSDQTQSIGEIIAAVNDLADQSNLLSVNASIEAAKAGEHGKGFAVVAHEVKSLADQSKQATGQIRTILNDIQKATSTAVMATERVGKAVDKGVELSGFAGDSIETLAENVTLSAHASSQISSSSEQQLVGMDQLAQAMESIKDASVQNVEGARQLAAATRTLEDLGGKLKELAGKFRV